MKYSVIVAFFRIFLFTHIFPTLIISNAGLGTEAEKVEELSPLFFSTPLTYWDQRKRGQSEKDIFGAPGKHRKFRIGSGGIGETQKQDCQNHKSTVG